MALAAGKLRHKVELQQPVVTQDAEGLNTTVWQTIATPWAEIVDSSAREFIAAAAEQSEVRGKITIRYRQDVDATMRIQYRGLTYQILGVLHDPVSMYEYMVLPVGEGVRVT